MSNDIARGPQSPDPNSSLVAPPVSSDAMTSTRSIDCGTLTNSSSNATTPPWLAPLMVAHGMTCFCPESATAIHQRPCFRARRAASSCGFSPLLALP